jgi:hypothetical protein
MVVNEQNRLKNSTLEILKGAATYVNRIREKTASEVNDKHLIFRISDYQDDIDSMTADAKY